MNSSELKFLVDVGVGKKIEEYLKQQGYDTKIVRDIDIRMADEDIVRLAALEYRMVMTMDKDFGELVYHSNMKHCGVLLLRMENATVSEKLEVITYILSNYSDRLKDSFCVYQKNRFRIRKIKRVPS